jgi:hypothetical protein
MDENDDASVLEWLEKSGIGEVYRIKRYFGHRTKDMQDVTIEIWDKGPKYRERFMCSASTGDGKRATGNYADTPETALSIFQWHKLD